MEKMYRTVLRVVVVVSILPATALAAESSQKPRVQATHKEVKLLCKTQETKIASLAAMCLDPNGNILACDAGAKVVKVVSPEDKLLATWKLDFAPSAVAAAKDGTAFVAGRGRIAKLDKSGRVLKVLRGGQGGLPDSAVTSVAVGGKDVFVVARAGTGYAVYRFDRNLGAVKKILDGLRGCCGQLDIAFRDGLLHVAENARKRIIVCDRDGKERHKWEKTDRKAVDGFAGCCNPMNLCIGPGGEIYTSESGPGRVKRYTKDGTFVAMVGTLQLSTRCTRVTVAVNKDGSRVYVLDTHKNLVHVLAGPPTKAKPVVKTGCASRSVNHVVQRANAYVSAIRICPRNYLAPATWICH